MKIHLAPVDETELVTLLPERAAHSTAHTLTADPADADLILFIGSFGMEPQRLLDHPLYKRWSATSAVYTEDDNYLPLLPGVYCSARLDRSSHAGRVVSYAYVSHNGRYTNPFVESTSSATKTLLFSFQGGSTSLLRKRLFNLTWQRTDVLIENTSAYFHWDLTQAGREDRQRRYASILARSHFVLCPRGAGAGSIRLFEVMSAGVAPVLLSDDYLLPPHVDWDSFLLRIPEKHLARLPELLEPYRATSAHRGALARQAWLEHFSPAREWDSIVNLCASALHHGPPTEAAFRRQQSRLIARARFQRHVRSYARGAALGILRTLHLKPPYQMNR